jgi:hypothetical protein
METLQSSLISLKGGLLHSSMEYGKSQRASIAAKLLRIWSSSMVLRLLFAEGKSHLAIKL